MKKLLLRLGIFLYHDVRDGDYKILTAIGVIIISFLFIGSVSINMIASFWEQDKYIDDEFDVGDTEVYKVINEAYERFMEDIRKRMDEREAEIIAENTQIIEEKSLDEDGNEVITQKEVCNVTVNKSCNGFSFAYVLAYINYTSDIQKTMSKNTMSSTELYNFMKDICVMDEIQNGNSYLLFTKVLTPSRVAEKMYTDKDVQEKYVLSYDIYNDFLGFVQNSMMTESDNGAGGLSDSYITGENLQNLISNLPADSDIAKAVIEFAGANLGAIYSQPKRTQSGYFDCSSFAYAAYVAAGVFQGDQWPPTAAELCRMVETQGTVSSVDNLQPGDLIFYNFGKNNGRYKNIAHVAIYVGNGMVMDASSSKGYTVHRKIYSTNCIVSAGRPYR